MADGRGFSFHSGELIEDGILKVAKADLGTKRVCPETGRKFYDLKKDPIVSPFTGTEYPLSFFEKTVKKEVKPAPKAKEEEMPVAETEIESDEVKTEDAAVKADAEVVSLEDIEDDDDDAAADSDVDDDDDDDVVDIPDLDEVEDDDADESDVFLEEDEEGSDVSDIIVGGPKSDEEDR